METNLKDKLAQLETDVAVIKDPALRRIAFERLLDGVIQRPMTPGVPRSSSRTQKVATQPQDRSSAKPKSKSKAAEFYAIGQVRDEVQNLTLSGTVDDLPTLKGCGKDWEKYLWVLAAVKERGVEGLNNHEIAFVLTKRLYKPTKYTAVNNIRLKVESGFVYPDSGTQRWIITPDGEEHLQHLLRRGDSPDKT